MCPKQLITNIITPSHIAVLIHKRCKLYKRTLFLFIDTTIGLASFIYIYQ